ncbi:hypothetical protein ACOKM3_07645 [Streptomyces sp. BH106]
MPSRTAPVGLCLVGPQGSDRHLLDLAVRVAREGEGAWAEWSRG